jgi:hypothetical protein
MDGSAVYPKVRIDYPRVFRPQSIAVLDDSADMQDLGPVNSDP